MRLTLVGGGVLAATLVVALALPRLDPGQDRSSAATASGSCDGSATRDGHTYHPVSPEGPGTTPRAGAAAGRLTTAGCEDTGNGSEPPRTLAAYAVPGAESSRLVLDADGTLWMRGDLDPGSEAELLEPYRSRPRCSSERQGDVSLRVDGLERRGAPGTPLAPPYRLDVTLDDPAWPGTERFRSLRFELVVSSTTAGAREDDALREALQQGRTVQATLTCGADGSFRAAALRFRA